MKNEGIKFVACVETEALVFCLFAKIRLVLPRTSSRAKNFRDSGVFGCWRSGLSLELLLHLVFFVT